MAEGNVILKVAGSHLFMLAALTAGVLAVLAVGRTGEVKASCEQEAGMA